jgi:hypothetical protein
MSGHVDDLYIGVPRDRFRWAIVAVVLLYASTYLIFPEGVMPDSELQPFFIGMTLMLIVHEAVHAVAAMISGVPRHAIWVEFRLERGVAGCGVACDVSRNKLLAILIAPIASLTLILLVAYLLSERTVLLALLWIHVSMALFDIMFSLDLMRLPRATVLREAQETKAVPSAVRLLNVSATELHQAKLSFFEPVPPSQLATPPSGSRVKLSWFSAAVFVLTVIEVVVLMLR